MISVVIPSYNSEQTIEKCLKALLTQTFQGDYEIILVDSSADATPSIVKNNFPKIKFFHLKTKTDPGTARNIGIREAKGGIIAFIDSDCIALPDWLEKIVSAHESSYNIVGGSVTPANNPKDAVGWAGYMAEFRQFLPELPKGEVRHIPTCNISYKKEIFQRFGLFDGKYYPQEDLVYNYNLIKSGEKMLFVPNIRVYHTHRSRIIQFLAHQEKIGRITAKVLKILPLEGAFIVRSLFLGGLLIPLLPLVKFLKTIAVFFKYQPREIIVRPMSVLILGVGLILWGKGFFLGALDKNSF